MFSMFSAWGREKATLNPIWPSRLKLISRNAIWIGFKTTYECSSKRICTNQISCSSLPFRLSKYDRILADSLNKALLSENFCLVVYDPDRSLSVNVSLTCCSLISSCSPPSNWAIFLPALRLSTVRIPTPSSSVSRTDRTCDWTLWEEPSAREPTMLSISSRNTMEGEHARAWANNWHTERQRDGS